MENQERQIHLKIKIKSLADEARTIRAEANKLSGKAKYRLNLHRTQVVRPAARHSLLVYALLRGVPYEVLEKKCNEIPNWKTIMSEAKRFGGEEEKIVAWIAAAKTYLKTYQPKEIHWLLAA